MENATVKNNFLKTGVRSNPRSNQQSRLENDTRSRKPWHSSRGGHSTTNTHRPFHMADPWRGSFPKEGVEHPGYDPVVCRILKPFALR